LSAAATPAGRTVRFRVAGATVAVAAADVSEVVRRPRMIRMPHGPSRLAGLANLRGAATPIFSLAGLLDRAETGEAPWAVLLNRSPAVALLVDRVESVSDGDTTPGFMTIDGGRPVALNELLAGQSAALQARSRAELPDVGAVGQAQSAGAATIGLLSFTLAGQNYALPLADIVAVVPLPARIRKARGASLGKATIRDRKVELVSLQAVLGLGDAAITGDERVIVVEVDGKGMGLVVDGARAILRAPDTAIGAPPALLNRESDPARIQSVLRLPDGRGVVSVLTVESLFHGGGEDAGETAATVPTAESAIEDTSRFVIFRIGSEEYGYPIEQIGEIVRAPEAMTRVPGAPDYVAGALNLRGAVVPILDQRQRFGAAETSAGRDTRILVVDIGGTRTGLLVDGIADIRQVAAGKIGAAPELSDSASRLFDRVITAQQDEPMILVVDPAMLLSRAELEQLAVISEAPPETARL
jgi:purine-binding chemotaxis protein CheW